MRLLGLPAAVLATLCVGALAQFDLDTSSEQSIKQAAKGIAKNLMKIYTTQLAIPGWGIPGLLPPPYYWWQSGGMFGVMLSYWHVTGDTQYNKLVSEAMLYQVGENWDYEPSNQTKSLGNDDQCFWGFTAMTAAEHGFPNPPPDKPQWLALAQAVWNRQQGRWNDDTCGGGLNWQFTPIQDGYPYKHTPSNAGFANLGARLYAYTGNETYAEWTEKMWNWVDAVGLIGGHNQWTIYDGTSEDDNCTSIDHTQWTYNFGMMLSAAAAMWNQTQDEKWRTRAQGIWEAGAEVFWREDKILREVTCERVTARGGALTCNNDQRSFKAYYIRWVAVATKWAPWLNDLVQPYFLSTAQAVSTSCNYGDGGIDCGQRWDEGSFFNATGPGEQMCALEAMNAMLIQQAPSPFTAKTGGTSKGDPSAGTSGDIIHGMAPPPGKVTIGDRAGAGILTVLVIGFTLGGAYFLVT